MNLWKHTPSGPIFFSFPTLLSQLECSAEDAGFPPATRADWTQDGAPLAEVSSLTLRVAEAGAASAGNYTCSPRNDAGSSSSAAAVNVEVHVAPRFVRRLARTSGEAGGPITKPSILIGVKYEICTYHGTCSYSRSDVCMQGNRGHAMDP